jgi:hypothetical protein
MTPTTDARTRGEPRADTEPGTVIGTRAERGAEAETGAQTP